MKNVYDGISRPPGSREIQKTEVRTVLVEILQIPKLHPLTIRVNVETIQHSQLQ